MFSRFFIDRPIFATVLAILMIIAGLITVKTLPIAQYPDITPPTVQVSATYPGADAQTVATTVAVPIEQAVNGMEGMMYMSSSSSDGSYSLTITFKSGTDIDDATVKVQNKIQETDATLPTPVKQQGISVNSRSTNIVMFVGLESDDPELYNSLYLTNYAQINIVKELERVPGVGGVGAFGAGEYSMRVWLNPELMRVRGITPAQVTQAIESQNMEVSAGSVGAAPSRTPNQFEYTVTARGKLTSADEFGDIILRTGQDGSVLRLKDVARVDLGSSSYSAVVSASGEPVGLIGIMQYPGANALDVARGCREKLKELEAYFPEGIHVKVLEDTTTFISASIDDVLVTFVETTLIVMVIILLFLQSWRATIIPMLTIPVSLIATFAVMKIMGFTINTLTLFGLLLAIALVVDDAIVVVEDCARILQTQNVTPRQAAEKAMVELQGPVVGEVLVLLSVFIPTAFISGITGELYKQFALTIAVSTAFSGFNALTFTPAMCALFLRKKKVGSDGKPLPSRFFLFRWWNDGFTKVLAFYDKWVGRFIKRPGLTVLTFVGLCVLAFWAFMKWPTSYIPSEDMGYFLTSIQLPTGAALDRTTAVVDQAAEEVLQLDGVADVLAISGDSFLSGSGSNVGCLLVVLEPWKDRKKASLSLDAIMGRVTEITDRIQEAIGFSINPPSIPGLGVSGGLGMQLLDINNYGTGQLMDAVKQMELAAKDDPRLESITTTFQGEMPQYTIDIDRQRAKLQGLTMDQIYEALSAYVGGAYVNNFIKFGNSYQVWVNSESFARNNPDDLLSLTVENANGDMVPFSSFAKMVPSMGVNSVDRYNLYTTAAITGTPAKGVSSSEAIAAMEEMVSTVLNDRFSYAWTGEAYQETQAGTTVSLVLIFAVILTILVLAAQYESWTDPIAVVLAMPTAIMGAIVGCIFLTQSVSIYTQIGIILLLGLAAKNAILIVEYAMDFRKAGTPVAKAALDGGHIRFRPIMMTALAFVFGVMPMIFATGAGAGSQIAIGTVIVFGMAVNAVIGTVYVPNFWALMQHVQEKYVSKIFAGADRGVSGPQKPSAPSEQV